MFYNFLKNFKKNLITKILFILLLSKIAFSEPSIKIVEPLDGAIFQSGEEITVTIEPIDGFDLQSALIITPLGSKKIIESPFTTNITIPKKALGTYKISALGAESTNTSPSLSNVIVVTIKPKASLQSLRMSYPPMLFLEQGFTNGRIVVYGMYSDGIERSISNKNTGTTYVSADENIVTVNEDGLVTPQGLGKTTITIANSGITMTIPATVNGEWLPPPEESVPPTITATLNPPANQAGWHNKDVTVTFVAKDNEGGSGVKEIIYVPTGATQQNRISTEEDIATLIINDEGVTLTQYWVIDNEGNSSKGKFLEIKLDKTPPVITAEWVPIVHEGEDDDDEEDLEYAVSFSATDNLDKNPSVIAVIETPNMLDPKVKLKTKENKKNEIKYVFELEDNEVKIEAVKPEEVWAEVQESGGIAVSNGQIIKVEYEDDEFTAKLKNGKLKIEAPEIILRVTATDAAGNQETILISPPSIPEEENGNDHDHGKDD